MADVRHQKKEGLAVSNRMCYVPKPICEVGEFCFKYEGIKRIVVQWSMIHSSHLRDSSYEWWILFGFSSDTVLDQHTTSEHR